MPRPAVPIWDHLNIDPMVNTSDKDLIEMYLEAAWRYLERQLGSSLEALFPAGDVPADLKLAACQLVATWYESRESVQFEGSLRVLPFGVQDTIDSYRTWSF